MLASGFAESDRVRRKLVPESVEIDAFSTVHQSLHVWSTEAKVPEQWIFEDLFPWPDAGQWRIDWNEPRNAVRILRGKSVANHVANIMRDEVNSVDFQLIKHARHVAGLRLLVKAS